jgi:hypothetical protein
MFLTARLSIMGPFNALRNAHFATQPIKKSFSGNRR